MKIPLSVWAARNYERPPKLPTLRKWAARKLINPAPEKTGREWMVDANAKYIPPDKPPGNLPDNISPRVRAILGGHAGA